AEHEVAGLSATNFRGALKPEKDDAVPVVNTREGRWLLSSCEDGMLATSSSGTEICLVPGGRGRRLAIPAHGAPHDRPK
ncbi:D-alanine--D-alanine ligase A, partial [Rhizobium ruizarguesonis]